MFQIPEEKKCATTVIVKVSSLSGPSLSGRWQVPIVRFVTAEEEELLQFKLLSPLFKFPTEGRRSSLAVS